MPPISKCPYVPGKLYEIHVYKNNSEEWLPAYYIGADGDGDHTFHVKGDYRYESYGIDSEYSDWFGADIREIVKERPKVCGWVNVYEKGSGWNITPEVHESLSDATANFEMIRKMYGVQREACVYVSE